MPTRRANGEGSAFYSETQQLWRSYWTLPNGSRRYASGRTAAEAVANRNRKRREHEQGLKTQQRRTMAQLCDAWLETVLAAGRRPRTWEEYKIIVEKHIKPWIGDVRVAELEPQQLRDLYSKRLRKLAPATVTKVHACVRGALRLALTDRMVPYNVALLVSPPSVPEYEARQLTVAEVARILLAIRDHRHGPLWTYLAGTGCRWGEAAGLQWSAVDRERRIINVRQGLARVPPELRGDQDGSRELADPKSRRSRRSIHLGGLVADALDRQADLVAALRERAGDRWAEQDLVFPNTMGAPLWNSKVLVQWHAVLKGIGLEGDGQAPIRHHDLRRAMATLVQDTGAGVAAARDILGHANIATTSDIYTGRLDDATRRAIDNLHAALEQAKSDQDQD